MHSLQVSSCYKGRAQALNKQCGADPWDPPRIVFGSALTELLLPLPSAVFYYEQGLLPPKV